MRGLMPAKVSRQASQTAVKPPQVETPQGTPKSPLPISTKEATPMLAVGATSESPGGSPARLAVESPKRSPLASTSRLVKLATKSRDSAPSAEGPDVEVGAKQPQGSPTSLPEDVLEGRLDGGSVVEEAMLNFEPEGELLEGVEGVGMQVITAVEAEEGPATLPQVSYFITIKSGMLPRHNIEHVAVALNHCWVA
jgi:hypothetical protein